MIGAGGRWVSRALHDHSPGLRGKSRHRRTTALDDGKRYPKLVPGRRRARGGQQIGAAGLAIASLALAFVAFVIYVLRTSGG